MRIEAKEKTFCDGNRISLPLSGITRLPVLEGEVSHVEIPRTSQSLGVTIVGGADTPLVSAPNLRAKRKRISLSLLNTENFGYSQ